MFTTSIILWESHNLECCSYGCTSGNVWDWGGQSLTWNIRLKYTHNRVCYTQRLTFVQILRIYTTLIVSEWELEEFYYIIVFCYCLMSMPPPHFLGSNISHRCSQPSCMFLTCPCRATLFPWRQELEFSIPWKRMTSSTCLGTLWRSETSTCEYTPATASIDSLPYQNSSPI